MPGKAIKIGPFNDGLNNVSLAGEATDKQVVKLVNFEVAPDNALQSRPPFLIAPGSEITTGSWGQWKIMGIYRVSSAQWFLIVAKPISATTYALNAYPSGDLTATPTVIKTGILTANVPSAYAQMDTFAYFCMPPAATVAGFKWSSTTSAADIATMPKGNCMVAYKSRLWIAGTDSAASKLSFSTIDATGYKPDVWNSADFTNVAPGEGGFITCLLALNSYILIFKNDGTWRFSYPSKPASGQIDKVSGSIGAANANAVVEFENYIYVYDQGKMYELVNNNYQNINRFTRFDEDSLGTDSLAADIDVSVVNRRIVVRYFNALYIYAVDSRTWSQWRTVTGTPGRFYEMPADSASTRPSTYIAASRGELRAGAVPNSVLITFADEHPQTPIVQEQISCLMRTKTYDYQLASGIKRLYWWGIDMRTNQIMKATVIPVAKEMLPTWGALGDYTHAELAAGTWGNPLSFKRKILNIVDGGDPSNTITENGRIFGKFMRALRFRQVIFEVEMTTQGTMDSLAKLYSLTTYVLPKDKVADKFN